MYHASLPESFSGAYEERIKTKSRDDKLKTWLLITKVRGQIQYKLYIGPYNYKDQTFLEKLNQEGIVSENAVWVAIQ